MSSRAPVPALWCPPRVLYARISHLGPAGSIDKQRIRRRYGHVSAAELEVIDVGLCLYLGLAL